jgi:hypothetical protein
MSMLIQNKVEACSAVISALYTVADESPPVVNMP